MPSSAPRTGRWPLGISPVPLLANVPGQWPATPPASFVLIRNASLLQNAGMSRVARAVVAGQKTQSRYHRPAGTRLVKRNRSPSLKFTGMTVNERIYLSGLIDEFDEAVEKKNADRVRSILEKVELSEDSIKPILEELGLSLMLPRSEI